MRYFWTKYQKADFYFEPFSTVGQTLDYTESHIKSYQPGSHVFRRYLGQLSTDFHEIW